MIHVEELYAHKLRKVAKHENKKMRQGMGYNIGTEETFSSPVLKVLEELGEATVNDIALRLKLKAPEVQSQLKRLQKLRLVSSEVLNCGRTPAIWSIKL